jgi:hypothetical protein
MCVPEPMTKEEFLKQFKKYIDDALKDRNPLLDIGLAAIFCMFFGIMLVTVGHELIDYYEGYRRDHEIRYTSPKRR